MSYATGKRSKAISDRSGMAFPYKEMVKEWNGSLVHISEFEPKHPQLDPPYHKADAIALKNPRVMKFQQPSQKFANDKLFQIQVVFMLVLLIYHYQETLLLKHKTFQCNNKWN